MLRDCEYDAARLRIRCCEIVNTMLRDCEYDAARSPRHYENEAAGSHQDFHAPILRPRVAVGSAATGLREGRGGLMGANRCDRILPHTGPLAGRPRWRSWHGWPRPASASRTPRRRSPSPRRWRGGPGRSGWPSSGGTRSGPPEHVRTRTHTTRAHTERCVRAPARKRPVIASPSR
jgi:hypothetical protein